MCGASSVARLRGVSITTCLSVRGRASISDGSGRDSTSTPALDRVTTSESRSAVVASGALESANSVQTMELPRNSGKCRPHMMPAGVANDAPQTTCTTHATLQHSRTQHTQHTQHRHRHRHTHAHTAWQRTRSLFWYTAASGNTLWVPVMPATVDTPSCAATARQDFMHWHPHVLGAVMQAPAQAPATYSDEVSVGHEQNAWLIT